MWAHKTLRQSFPEKCYLEPASWSSSTRSKDKHSERHLQKLTGHYKVIHESNDVTAVSGFMNSAMKMLMQNNSGFPSSSLPLTVVSGSSVQLSWSTFLTYCCLVVRTPTNCANGKPAVLLTPSSESSGWAPPLQSCWGQARSSRSSPCASCCACCRRRG